MGEKIVVGPINKGIQTDRTAFVIDNDSFPILENAYQWRGRVKRKRGTEFLGRLTRYFDSLIASYNPGTTTQVLSGGGAGNLLTGFASSGIQTDSSVVPGSVTITDNTTARVYTDPSMDGTLTATGGSGTINYATGAFTIAPAAADTVSAKFKYYPTLPVLGLEDLVLNPDQPPGTVAFDQTYSYNISTSSPYNIWSVSFYKNLATATYPGYTQKTVWTPTTWNGQDYQQFWTVNYQQAFWATNGIPLPFVTANIGMQYKAITVVDNITAGPPALADITFGSAHGLVVGDFLFINEVLTTTGINFQTGYVTVVVSNTKVTVEFPNATLANNGTLGIAQYLTSRADPTKDSLRWYDGDPTTGNPAIPAFQAGRGWVNFAPPLSVGAFSIADLPAAKYYLVGARMVVPFKDRLVFIGPVVQTSTPGSQVYLPDTVIYSQNGTPFYTCSFPYATVNPVAGIATNPILLPAGQNFPTIPTNQTATYSAYWEDQTGFGGFVQVGVSQPINTTSSNEDVLIFGLSTKQIRFVYTGNDIIPFEFYIVNSELGSESTFSAVNLDRGVITVGSRGIVIASQTQASRVDLPIPDQVFQINLTSNGSQRVCSQRDFINEWIYFTYRANENKESIYVFPTQTLQYNYRDDTWAIFNECYTNYGTFRKVTGETWASLANRNLTWDSWNEPWDSGDTTLLQPEVIAGNQQGFVVFRTGQGTDESKSLQIKSVSGNVITSPNHCLNNGDYIVIGGCLGTISAQLNGKIFSVAAVTTNTFTLRPTIGSGTYLGGGTVRRLYVPVIQSKQFPPSWSLSRKTRLGVQQYLLTATAKSQITLYIYLSENAATAYNNPAINDGLIYSTILYTCTESTNLGLTAANTNLQMITPNEGSQIWHRINTSLIGDTVQVAFTMSDDQMMLQSSEGTPVAITGATQANPCVLTCAGAWTVGQMIQIDGVVGMNQLNFRSSDYNYYYVLSSTTTTVTIDVDASAFTAYVSGGTATPVAILNQVAEVEVHSMILDVNPSSVLA